MSRSSEGLIESRLRHLRNEVSTWDGYVRSERPSSLLERLDAVLGRTNPGFAELKKAYDRLSFEKAVMLHELTEVAASYRSMDEFWADADAQERGDSRRTFWDTYEHGRRRQIESQLAALLWMRRSAVGQQRNVGDRYGGAVPAPEVR